MADIPKLPQNVVSLVIAAREAFDTGMLPDDEQAALDKALEPFASAVPYENEPATRAAPPAMDREAVLEALELADATLRGANMDRAFVERKVTAAITGLKSTSTVPADTMVILHALLTEYAGQPNQAGEAYKLVDATLSADAIRQGEGEASNRVIYLLQGDNSRMAAALRSCRDQFAFYAREHTVAGKSEKAATNARFAKIADDALTAIKPATPASPASDGGKA